LQVEDLRRQLQTAEDTARERELAAVAAAERAAAAQSLIDSLRARAVAAEAEAKPLRAQLAELADTLDVKVCFVTTARTVSGSLHLETPACTVGSRMRLLRCHRLQRHHITRSLLGNLLAAGHHDLANHEQGVHRHAQSDACRKLPRTRGISHRRISLLSLCRMRA